tara:strand:+ start:82190 stop:85942 length:3753 start_codon:yes stop_codon:yes gene_type:complete
LEDKFIHFLNPDNFKIDDRNLEDLILFVQKLSKKYKFFDLKNKATGDWFDMFASDESFLLAEIYTFEIQKYDLLRLSLTQSFDELSSDKEKKEIFQSFFELIFTYFKIINEWYTSATRNNLSQQSSEIELAIEQTIQKKILVYFEEFTSYALYFEEDNEQKLNLNISFKDFKTLWGIKNITPKNIFKNIDSSQSPLSSGLKKLILLYTPVYESLLSLQFKAARLFHQSIEGDSNHKAHVGLLITFLKLYEYVRDDLNALSKKHLDFYYKVILSQNPNGVVAKNMFINIQIDENIDFLTIDQGALIVAGQNSDGSQIIYQTEEEVILNNAVISDLRTLFLSRNNYFDYNSRNKLVSGIYSKTHCADANEVNTFNNNEDVFSTLGEDQVLITDSERTMDNARIGFAIASPSLVLGKSNREVNFNFTFSTDSIKFLSNLIIDIANRKGVTDKEVFYDVFNRLFTISFTNEEGWVEVTDYDIDYPSDWTLNTIGIRIKLPKQYPSVDNYQEDLHALNLNATKPVFQFLINSNEFYYPYSFLSRMEISKIDVDVKVLELKNLKVITNQGMVDVNSEFDLLGVNPLIGSSIMLGTHELFCKRVNQLSLGWTYTNLPNDYDSIEQYYKSYNRDIKDDSFSLKLTALSDYTFKRSGTKEIEIEMFQADEKGNTLPHRFIEEVKVESFNLKPNFDLREEDLLNYSNDDETGYIKMELVSPRIGFGSASYPSIYSKSVTEAAENPPKREAISIELPNEPYSPLVKDFFVNYQAQSSLYFNESSVTENDSSQDNRYYLISPFGVDQTFSKHEISDNHLIHPFSYEGELIIGLENINAPQSLNLLIEIKKSGNENYAFTQNLEWLYSGTNGWKQLSPNDIIYDETINLTKTGVISISIPVDISNDSNLFNNNKFYIKACSKTQADQFSLIKAVYINGVRTVECFGEVEIEKTEHLPPQSVESFSPTIAGVINIDQPMKTVGGKDKESPLEFYKRVSQILHHKNRPITKSDIEKFVLQQFNWLSYAKCYTNDHLGDELNTKNIKLLCLKKIDETQNIDEIKLSTADKIIVVSFLEKIISPFAKVEIISPQFEDLWIKCKMKFADISGGKGIAQFNKEFFNHLCPWAHSEKERIILGQKIKKSEIIKFIKSRPYISFVTGISIIHIKTLEDGSKLFHDSANSNENSEFIQTGTVQSLLVPRKNKIVQLDQEVYSEPERTDLFELGVGENFIISSDREENQFLEVPEKIKSNKIKTKPFTFNFKF